MEEIKKINAKAGTWQVLLGLWILDNFSISKEYCGWYRLREVYHIISQSNRPKTVYDSLKYLVGFGSVERKIDYNNKPVYKLTKKGINYIINNSIHQKVVIEGVEIPVEEIEEKLYEYA